MKICIPTVDDRGLDARVAGHFGSAPYFTMVDLDQDGLETVANPACRERQHACHHVGQLTARRIEVLACHGVGRRAFQSLRDAGIRILVSTSGTVAGVVDDVRSGRARAFREQEACGGRHGHGHGSEDHVGSGRGRFGRGHGGIA
jgi:predicted Fe-Mo cluster-binding NifX family protein